MAKRDRVSEIAEKKRRGPKAARDFHREFQNLQKLWQRTSPTNSDVDDFFLIRAVTLLEVFSGDCLAQLIDNGSPYAERSVGLDMHLKIDLGFVQAIQGRVITMRAKAAGVRWPLSEDWDEARVEAAVFPRSGFPPAAEKAGTRTPPDFAAIHQQLRTNKYVTLQLLWEEYRQANPDGYRYSRFCYLYQRWRSKLDVVWHTHGGPSERVLPRLILRLPLSRGRRRLLRSQGGNTSRQSDVQSTEARKGKTESRLFFIKEAIRDDYNVECHVGQLRGR